MPRVVCAPALCVALLALEANAQPALCQDSANDTNLVLCGTGLNVPSGATEVCRAPTGGFCVLTIHCLGPCLVDCGSAACNVTCDVGAPVSCGTKIGCEGACSTIGPDAGMTTGADSGAGSDGGTVADGDAGTFAVPPADEGSNLEGGAGDYDVGCGCNASAAPWAALAVVAVSARRRRGRGVSCDARAPSALA
jgi:hypothetical protein